MFAGIMMTAMHKSMEGTAGLKGWQWVFLVGMHIRSMLQDSTNTCDTDGLMGIPIGIFGLVSNY